MALSFREREDQVETNDDSQRLASGLCSAGGLACALFLLLLWVFGQTHSSAQINPDFFHVTNDCSGLPNCFLSVQAALNATFPGDVIRVASGTYSETMLITRDVTLQGGWDVAFATWDPDTNVTTLHAEHAGPVVRVEEGASPTVEGFVITGGDASNAGGQGGGIRVDNAGQVTIRHNVITDNIACGLETCIGQGGGIAVLDAAAIITSNTIISNVAHTEPAGEGHGGGVFIADSASATLHDNDVLSNTASFEGLGMGGGVFVGGPTTAHGNLVQGNTTSNGNSGSGGGVYGAALSRADTNIIVENTARQGGGVYLAEGAHAQQLIGNTILRNHAVGTGPIAEGGGGICSKDDGAQIIHNDIISNTAAYFGGGVLLASGSDYVVQRNLVQSNSAPYGGGIFAYASTGIVQANWIVENSAHTRGGGVYLYANGVPRVDANHILSNTVTAGDAGGLCVRNNTAAITLTNQVVAHNSAINGGDGVHVSFSSDVRFLNNTVVDNGQSGTSDTSEGLVASNNSTIVAANNLLVGHGVAISVAVGSSAGLDYNGYHNNDTNTAGTSWGPNHVHNDPDFVDRLASNYHLLPSSPMQNAGDGSRGVTQDFERDPRPALGGMEIGADEISLRLYLALTVVSGP